MKKQSLLIIFLGFLMIFSGFVSLGKKTYAEVPFENKSKSYILLNVETGEVISKLNENTRLPIASMCKIMTLLLTFEKIDNNELFFDESIIVSKNAAGMGGSQIFLEEGGEYKVEDLIKGIVVASANDACVAIAERLCGSEENFVLEMNKKAFELKMTNTCFVNCTGLPKEGQYSSAKDVASMYNELIKHEDYFKFSSIWMDKINHPKERVTDISNTNKLVKYYEGCLGGKTGYTQEAGHCLAAVAKRNNMTLISVVISAPDSKTRFNEVSEMFNYGFNNYRINKIVDGNKPLDFTVDVRGANNEKLQVCAQNDIIIFSRKDVKRSFEYDFIPSTAKFKAPINKNDILGKLVIYENGIEVASVNIIALNDVKECSYFDYLIKCLSNWFIV